MSSGSWGTFLRRLALGCFLLATSLLLFFTYFKEKVSFFSVEACRTAVCPEDAPTRDSNPNQFSVQQDQAPCQDADTVLLIWTWPFGLKFDLGCSAFNVTRCRLTDDRSLYHKAHGILFHHRDIPRNLAGFPREPRPCYQKWVWSNMESPANSAPIGALDHLFNLTCSYRLDSDVPVPYGYLVPLTSEDERFKLPEKTQLVCWVVSNWNSRHRRVQFYQELKKHVPVSAYGSTFHRSLSDGEYVKVVSSCKFYLSFENSEARDYITEKFYRPMMLGSVPVALGPPRQNYEDHVPADSFIHVDDFPSPKALAERLLQLDQDAAEYTRFFNWTNRFRVHKSWFGKEHACKTCGYLQTNRGRHVTPHLNKWYWG